MMGDEIIIAVFYYMLWALDNLSVIKSLVSQCLMCDNAFRLAWENSCVKQALIIRFSSDLYVCWSISLLKKKKLSVLSIASGDLHLRWIIRAFGGR